MLYGFFYIYNCQRRDYIIFLYIFKGAWKNFDIYSIIIPVQNKEKVMEKVIEIEHLTGV